MCVRLSVAGSTAEDGSTTGAVACLTAGAAIAIAGVIAAAAAITRARVAGLAATRGAAVCVSRGTTVASTLAAIIARAMLATALWTTRFAISARSALTLGRTAVPIARGPRGGRPT